MRISPQNPRICRNATRRHVTCLKKHMSTQRLTDLRDVSHQEKQVISRQDFFRNMSIYLIAGQLMSVQQKAEAAMPPGFKKDLGKKRKIRESIDASKFTNGPEGLKYFDEILGDGEEAKQGSRVAVHFDAKWRGITFVTTRQGMGVTGGSPFGFDIGAPPGQGGTLKGLDLGVRGMRVGGQRKLIVPSVLAYGEKGYGEIPPNAELIIDVQLLSIKKNAIGTQVKLIEG